MTGLGQICLATFLYNTVYDFCLQNCKVCKTCKLLRYVEEIETSE